jgi:hypothetical protein
VRVTDLKARTTRETCAAQALVNAGLSADMSLGRWIWRSGKTKAGRAVPWNVQTLNSDPDNFVWEKDKACGLFALCEPASVSRACEPA